MKYFFISLYMVCITLSNVVTASFTPIHFGDFLIPYGTFLIGFTFIFRDAVQKYIGKIRTYLVIFSAMIVSALVSWGLGDTLWIVFASAITFAISETSDTEVFTRLKSSLEKRVLYSGIIGGTLDSAIFVIIGLSPLGAGFIPWDFVGYAILGQFIVKTTLQFIAYFIIHLLNKEGVLESENLNTRPIR